MRVSLATLIFVVAVTVAAGCNQETHCCFVGTLVVTEAADVVTVKGATRGFGCTYAQDEIVCQVDQDGLCYNPFRTVQFMSDNLTITGVGDGPIVARYADPAAKISLAGFYVVDEAGYQYFEGAMYKFSPDQMTQVEAQAACLSEGSKLASIASIAENEFVYSLHPVPSDDRWLGAVRVRDAGNDPFVFAWIDGTPFPSDLVPSLEKAGCQAGGECQTSENGCCIWKKNEPNDRNPLFTPENCVSQGHIKKVLNPAGWDDSDCNNKKAYVCKRPVACVSTIVQADENEFATSRCKNDATVGKTCRSDCSAGYIGGPATFECTSNGLYQLLEGNDECVAKDCGTAVPQLPEHSSANCSTDTEFNLYVSAVCEAACDDGYVVDGDATYQCDASGEWEAVSGFTCEPVNCGSEIADLSDYVTASCDRKAFFDGTDCVAQCEDGFLPIAGTGVYTCGADGNWAGELVCAPIDCGTYGPDAAEKTGVEIVGAACGGQTFFGGDKCTLQCGSGYEPVADLSPVFTCGADGVWGGEFACQKISCGFFAPNFLNVVDGCSDGTFFESVCSISCPFGFELPESMVDVPEWTCEADSMWRGPIIACQRVDCGPLQATAPAATVVVDESCDTQFSSVCSLGCRPGFQQEFGSASYRCGSTGVWEGNLVCGRITCQPLNLDSLDANSNVDLVKACDDSLFQSECKAQCLPGYEPATGSDTFFCNQDGKWDGQYSCQKKDCGLNIPFDVLGEFASANCEASLLGDSCIGICDAGYENVAYQTGVAGDFVCGTAGQWEGYTNCQPVNCGANVPNPGQFVTGSCFGDTRYTGTSCVLDCVEGYHLSATTTGVYTCSAEGNWQGDAVCEPNKCPAIGLQGFFNDPNTRIACEKADSADFAFTQFGGPGCTGSCNDGYQPIMGDGIITCNADSTWSGELKCGPIDCAPIEGLVNAKANCADFEFESACQATCLPGYLQGPSGGNGVFTCTAEKVFSGAIQCDPIDCPATVADLVDATAACTSTKFGGAACVATCDDGFVGGSSEFTCGTDGQWKGNLQCFRKDCGALVPLSATGNYLRSNCPDSLFEDKCAVTCAPGYSLFVEDESVDSGSAGSSAEGSDDFIFADSVPFTCGVDAFWTAPQSMCLPKSCGALESSMLDNRVANCSLDAEILFDGEGCIVQCAPNYKRVSGSNLFTCGVVGSWVSDLQCAPVDCGATILDLESKNAVSSACEATEFNDQCQASCRAGTEQSSGINDATFTCDGATGMWTGVIMCTPKQCGAMLPVVEATPGMAGAHYASTPRYQGGVCAGDTRFGGDNCAVECADGYNMVQGNGVFICDEDGVWAGEAVCSPVNCHAMLPAFDTTNSSSADALYNCTDPVFQGTPCSATCRFGYESAIVKTTYICGADGEWTSDKDGFACTAVMCPAEGPVLSKSATADCSENAFFEAGSCQAACKPGYEATRGDGVYTCSGTGSWIGELECRPKNCGADITTIDGATTDHRVCLSSDYRGVCIAFCKAGYTAVAGNPLFRCGTEGLWEGDLVCEENLCPSMPVNAPPNTDQNRCQRNVGSTCQLSCARGYTSVGDGSYTCNEQGVWLGGCGFECVDASFWTKFENGLYHVDLERKTQSDAGKHCREEDSRLVTITSVVENDFVYELSREATTETIAMWTSYQLIRTSTPQTAPFDYLGSDGIVATYAETETSGVWAENEPNDYRGEENCVAIGHYDARKKLPNKWNDINCNEKYASVCERSAIAQCSAEEIGLGGFYVAFTSLGLGADGMRFSTALEPAHIITHLNYNGKADGESVGSVAWACRDECADEAACLGFFIQQRGADLSCNLLNDLGVPIPTSSTSQSYVNGARVVDELWNPTDTTTAPTTTAAPTTTSAPTTTAAPTTTSAPTTVVVTTAAPTTGLSDSFGFVQLYTGSVNGARGRRFSTAYAASAKVGDDMKFNDVALDSDMPQACLQKCSEVRECVGVVYRVTNRERGLCRFVNSLGVDGGVSTNDIGSSWGPV